jgi:hypothetical protein
MTSTPTELAAGLFDDSADWEWAPTNICQREGLHPNLLAYSASRAAICLIVRRSPSGDDFAVSEAGLRYLEAALEDGARGDGKTVLHGLVVQAIGDPLARNRQRHLLKAVCVSTVKEIRDRIQARNIPLQTEGRFGPFFWIPLEYSGDFVSDDDPWSLRRQRPETDGGTQ